jgi:AcrR family transcriptional regulator
MEAAAGHPRELSGDKAQRIIDAMRSSVAARGAAGSTFDQVAREAGVSRGLLHYYFGTKERLLVEVVRRDCDIRMAVLDQALAGAHTVDALIDALVHSLEDMLENDPGFLALVFELFTSGRRNAEIAAELAELYRRTSDHLAGQLERKQAEGVIRLTAEPDAVATALYALADGLSIRMLSQVGDDFGPALAAAVACARTLIAEPA